MNNSRINIVDFQYIYYKYINLIRIGKLRQLSFDGKDTTMLYYPLKEIEGFSEKGTIKTCVCFDSKAEKKEMDASYKSNRKSTLGDEDYNRIDEIRDILKEVGYEVYKADGYEADDLVASLTNSLKDKYDEIHIYTVDKDLLQLIDSKVTVHLFRASKGYMEVNKRNFAECTEKLFKVYIPFNMVKVFKSLCGDSSDNIKGVKGFGPSAFTRWLSSWNIVYSQCNDNEYIKNMFMSTLKPDQIEQAIQSLEMVTFREIELEEPFVGGITGNRKIYSKYGMNSFLK